MAMGTMLFNPFTGKPRDPRDIASDPKGILIWDGEEPMLAAPKRSNVEEELMESAIDYLKARDAFDNWECEGPNRLPYQMRRDALTESRSWLEANIERTAFAMGRKK